jgi:hypothetical protein
MSTPSQPDRPEKSDDKAYFWRYATVVAVVLGLPGTVYTVVQLVDRANKASGPEFVVSVTPGRFELPLPLLKELAGDDPALNEDVTKIERTYDLGSMTDPDGGGSWRSG